MSEFVCLTRVDRVAFNLISYGKVSIYGLDTPRLLSYSSESTTIM